MTVNLGGTSEVRAILGRSTEELSDSEVIAKLNEADRKIRNRHHQKYSVDKFYAATTGIYGSVLKVYNLFFTPKSGTTVEVYVNGSLLTLTSDYTISSGTLTFTASYNLNKGDLITIFYTPDFFDDYANYLAAERLYSVSLVDTNNGVGKAVYDSIKEIAKEYEKLASSKPIVARMVDHREDYDIY